MDASTEGGTILEGKRADVHKDVVNGVLRLFVVYDVCFVAVVERYGLVAEVGADLGHQGGVQRDGDGEFSSREHLPLDGRNFRVEAVANLEEMGLTVALGADAIGTIGVGAEAGNVFATIAKGANKFKSIPTGLFGLEEQRLHFIYHGANLSARFFASVLDDFIVGALSKRSPKVIAALDVARPSVNGSFVDGRTVGLGNIELSVVEILGETLFFR